MILAFTNIWSGIRYPTYDIDLKLHTRKDLSIFKQGVYVVYSDREIEFGRSDNLEDRLAGRKYSTKWTSQVLVLDMSDNFGKDAHCFVEVTCIHVTHRKGSGKRTMRNIRCRNSLGGFFYPSESPLIDFGEEWRSSVLGYLGEDDNVAVEL